MFARSYGEILQRRLSKHCLAMLVLATIVWLPAEATAQELLEQLFGGFQRAPVLQTPSTQPLGYANPLDPGTRAPARQLSVGSSVSYCVRLCDGRFFPVPRLMAATPVQQCNALCPASPTKIYSGTEIGRAVARDGSRYTALKNAFLYRKRLVPTCTCNGKDSFGLARLDTDTDPTVATGDVVATDNGRMIFISSRSNHGGNRTAKKAY